MSYAIFLASDLPMPEMDNPHKQLLSVNEALAKGYELPNFVLDSDTIDSGESGVILCFDSEENLGEIEIRRTERPYYYPDDYGNPPDTNLLYLSSLEWNYTEERAGKLVEYIRKHLESATVLEIWHYWIGCGRDISNGMKKHSVNINELSVAVLGKLFTYDLKEPYDCIVVRRT
jgi:hypothetical protein